MSRQHGFTLLELLVAITIFAIVSTISYGTLIRIIDLDEHLEQERRYWQNLSSAMLRLEDDLAHAIPRTVRSVIGVDLAPFLGQPTDPRPLSPPSLEFTRGGQWTLETSAIPGMQRVAWRLSDGKLVRQVWPTLDRPPTAEPRSIALVDGVEQFDLRFLSANGNWHQQWPESTSGVIPDGIELQIKIRNRPVLRRVFIVNG